MSEHSGEQSEHRLWGGRFEAAPAQALWRVTRADPQHYRLIPYDIAGSIAHARQLERAGVLDAGETAALTHALGAIAHEVRDGTSQPQENDEDIHSFVERRLVERLGPGLGGKLRAGRSRNDQAANDLKLYLRREARSIVLAIGGLQRALMAQAARHTETLAPGFTHLQPAQPIVLAHQLLAHVQALARDVSRFMDWDVRTATCPLGAAALAGTAFVGDAQAAAAELGYDRPCENSIDAVGSRDHVAEFLFACAMSAVDLSRLGEEIVLWSSPAFGWIRLDAAFSTGSSIMPQKRNPDIAELARGRSARLVGDLTTVLTLLKGLPFAYNRDLSDDKRAAFDAVDTLLALLPAMAGLVETMSVDRARVESHCGQGFTLATEVADWLVRQGVPFAQAHTIVGKLVSHCERNGTSLEALDAQALAGVDARLEVGVLRVLDARAAVAARSAPGGTAFERVREQARQAQTLVERQGHWATAYSGPTA
jgi:argininosuccinate lyase